MRIVFTNSNIRQACCQSTRWRVLIGACAVVVLAVPHAGRATPPQQTAAPAPQTQAPASASSTAKPVTTLGEVMVTADRIRQPSREVPMHVDTVSAKRLQQLGAANLSDYVSYQPGVFFASQGGPGQGTLIMRGVSTGNQTSPTVAVYLDDVPIGGSTVYSGAVSFVFDSALMDIDHVEFLFGPQGTLYGSGSMGGLVKYVTNRPDTSGFSGNAGFDISKSARANLSHTEHATVNVPLVKDVAALRVSVLDRRNGGDYRAVGETPSAHADRAHTRGARVQLQVYPSSRLSFNLSAMGQQIATDGLSMADYDLKTQTPSSGGRYDRRLNHREPFTQTLALYALRAHYSFDWAELDWISAYQNFTNHSVQDYPDNFIGLLNVLGPSLGVDQKVSSLYVDSQYDLHKATQEIRFTSPGGSAVDWLAGLWFSREDVWERFDLKGENLPPPGTYRLLGQRVTSRFQEYAAFGDATWHLGPAFDITFGARVSGNTQTLANFEDGPVAGSPGGFREHTDSSDTTGMLTAKYHPDKHNAWYVRASSGYRPGGLQAPIKSTIFGSNPNVTETFEADNLISYEAGYKGNFLGGLLSIGGDVYDIEWRNLQIPTYTVGNAIIINEGDARINGLEFQSSFRPGHFRFDGSLAWTDARMVSTPATSGITRGAPLPYSARWTASLMTRYGFAAFGGKAYVGANVRATTRRNAGFNGNADDPGFDLPGHALLDLDTGITLHNATSIDFYLRNVLNRQLPVGTLNTQTVGFLGAVGGPMLVHQSTPRTVGVSVDVSFR